MSNNKIGYTINNMAYIKELAKYSSYVSLIAPPLIELDKFSPVKAAAYASSNPLSFQLSGTLFLFYLLEACFYENIITNSTDYKDLKVLYDEVIKNTCELIKELDMSNPVSVFSSFVYLNRGGYLSDEKKFSYNMDLKDLKKLMGLDVLRGNGVCRSVASMLNDIYNELGYDSNVMAVYATKEAIETLDNLSIFDKPLHDEKTKNNVKMIIALTKILKISNHLITMVSDNEKVYVLDPTNDGFLLPQSSFKYLTGNGKRENMVYKPFATSVAWSPRNLVSINNKKSLPTITKEEYKKIYLEAQDKMIKNIDMLDKFYNNNKDIYSEVADKSENIMSVVQRLSPVLYDFLSYTKKISKKNSL